MEPCKIGMEACSGAHETARRLKAMGHDARIIAPKYVVKFRQKQKNDANDAEAICETLLHRTTRFIPIKSVEQQAVLCLHRIRAAQVRLSEPMQRVHEILGVGEITASAVVATVGNATDFKYGRQFAAWLGLVPEQYSTGGNRNKPVVATQEGLPV